MDLAHLCPILHGLLAEAVDQLVRSDDQLLPLVGGRDPDLALAVIARGQD